MIFIIKNTLLTLLIGVLPNICVGMLYFFFWHHPYKERDLIFSILSISIYMTILFLLKNFSIPKINKKILKIFFLFLIFLFFLALNYILRRYTLLIFITLALILERTPYFSKKFFSYLYIPVISYLVFLLIYK